MIWNGEKQLIIIIFIIMLATFCATATTKCFSSGGSIQILYMSKNNNTPI